jgi:hypothetical protein
MIPKLARTLFSRGAMPAPSIRRFVRVFVGLTLLTGEASGQVPQNGWIAWASDRQDSRHEIYLMQADGSNVQRLTQSGGVHPSWSPDGAWIAYEAADGSAHVMRWDKSEDKQVFTGTPRFWMHDGSGLFCSDKNDVYHLVDPDTGSSKQLYKKSDFGKVASKSFSPNGITHDGVYLMGWSDLYRTGFTGDNGTFKAYNAAVILDLTDKAKVYFFGDGCEPTAPPSGSLIYHVCGTSGQCPYGPDIVRMDVKDLATRASYATEISHDDADWGHEYFPRVSNDNKWLVYGATTGCHDHNTCDYEIFVHALGGGNSARTRVTTDSHNDQWPHLWVGALWQPVTTPELTLSPTALSFDAGSGTGEQTVTVKNTGEGTLGPVSTAVSYGTGSGWLTVSAEGAGNSQTLRVGVKLAGLAGGSYSATIQVTEPSAESSPRSVAVTLTVPVSEAGVPVATEAGVPRQADAGVGYQLISDQLVGGCAMGAATWAGDPAVMVALALVMVALTLLLRLLGRRGRKRNERSR